MQSGPSWQPEWSGMPFKTDDDIQDPRTGAKTTVVLDAIEATPSSDVRPQPSSSSVILPRMLNFTVDKSKASKRRREHPLLTRVKVGANI